MTILTSVNMHYRKALVAASDKLSRQLSKADQAFAAVARTSKTDCICDIFQCVIK